MSAWNSLYSKMGSPSLAFLIIWELSPTEPNLESYEQCASQLHFSNSQELQKDGADTHLSPKLPDSQKTTLISCSPHPGLRMEFEACTALAPRSPQYQCPGATAPWTWNIPASLLSLRSHPLPPCSVSQLSGTAFPGAPGPDTLGAPRTVNRSTFLVTSWPLGQLLHQQPEMGKNHKMNTSVVNIHPYFIQKC